MKLLLIIYSGTDPERCRPCSIAQPAATPSCPDAHGAGRPGGARAPAPGPAGRRVLQHRAGEDLVMTVTAARKAEAEALPPGERLHVAVMPIEFTSSRGRRSQVQPMPCEMTSAGLPASSS
jgi:hypothetical protein